MSFNTSGMDVFVDVEVEELVYDLRKMIRECYKRGLRHTAMWASELYDSLGRSGINLVEIDPAPVCSYYMSDTEVPSYLLAKSHFDCGEYEQAAYFTKDCVSSVNRFLHFYSKFCSGESKRLDFTCDSSFHSCPRGKNKELPSLCAQLRKMYFQYKLDGFLMYLYGIVLKKMQLEKEAITVFIEAVNMEPLNWGAWLELSILIHDFAMLADMQLPHHWMKNFFFAHTYLELQLNDIALKFYNALSMLGFSPSTYIMAQNAICYHNMRKLNRAIAGFRTVASLDPYRLDNLDIYSNLLYVKDMRAEMGELAFNSAKIDKYRVETCCVVGNYYSLGNQHTKAVLYFKKASQANPNYLSAWTLMGHEYTEMKNTSFAIQAYRQAIDVSRRDYRAWYGLGQTYEVLKMPFYCLYYYKQAQQLRPRDSRMIVALGDSYERLEKYTEAKKCYWKAHAVGDPEGIALLRLGKLCEKLNEEDQAAKTYDVYCKAFKAKYYTDQDSGWSAHFFLARFHFRRSELKEAFEYAEKCLEFPEAEQEAKNEAKLIMQQVRNRQASRALDDASITNVDFKVPLDIWDNRPQ